MRHPAVAGFCAEHGIELGFDASDTAEWLGNLGIGDQPRFHAEAKEAASGSDKADIEEKILSTDPIRVRVTIHHRDAALNLTIDENLNLVDLTQGQRTEK